MSIRLSFNREAIDFILDHYQELRCGIDPEPASPECEGRAASRYHAPGLVLIEWAGEVGARVRLCGIDGLLVELRYGMRGGDPLTEAEIERTRHIPLFQVLRRINRVKWFCVGKRRKCEPYEAWRQQSHDRRILRSVGVNIATPLDKSLPSV